MASTALIQTICRTMDELLGGRVIQHIDIPYKKCANLEEFAFNKRTCGASVLGVYCRDKWIVMKLSNDQSILVHLGLSANVLFHEKEQDAARQFDVRLRLSGESAFTIKYWMGGKFWLSADDALPAGLRAREYMRKVFETRLPCEGETLPHKESHGSPR